MAEVVERTPLGGRADDLARISAREVPFVTQLAVRSRSPETLGLPTGPNTWVTLEGFPREALWLGPDEWLVVGPRGTPSDPGAAAGAFGLGLGDPVAMGLEAADSVVDVSANRAVLELRGEDRAELLARGCSLDLDPRSWRPGMCAQTLLATVQVLLQERENATRVFVRPSFADWLVDWLLAVAS